MNCTASGASPAVTFAVKFAVGTAVSSAYSTTRKVSPATIVGDFQVSSPWIAASFPVAFRCVVTSRSSTATCELSEAPTVRGPKFQTPAPTCSPLK